MLQSKRAARQDLIRSETPDGDRLTRASGSGNRGDHPFAGFVRAVGRGKNLSRSLSEAEAAEAMAMILDGRVEAEQLGAFLIVLRYRGETPQELAGFVRAVRERLDPPRDLTANLDWPSYADRHRQLPYFVLAALLLAGQGIKVAMHGITGVGPVTTPKMLDALGIAPAQSFDDVAEALETRNFAYLPIEAFCSPLADLFKLRPVLGVRSAANTFARELNPLRAPCQLQGVFHPTYLPAHQEAARLLGQPHAAVFKGGGGEVQRNPEKPCRVATLSDGSSGKEIWPALMSGGRYPWRDEPLDPDGVAALWRGGRQAPGPEAAVVGTAAVALKLLGRAETQEEAQAQAEALWQRRPKKKYGL